MSATFDAYGHQRQSTFTSDDNVQRYTTPLGAQFTASYDSQDRATGFSLPVSGNGIIAASQGLAYNQGSTHPFYPDSTTDAQGNQLTYGYDASKNLSSVTDQLAQQNHLNLAHNANGTVSSSTDADGHVTAYGYDAKGNLTSVTPATLGGGQGGTQIKPTIIGYDALSRPNSITDGKGQKTTYTYDGLDRVKTVTYQDGSSVSYNYDGDGNRLTRVDHLGTTTDVFDLKNRLTKETVPGGRFTSYTYDGADNLKTLTDAGGTVSYGYDSVNRLSSVAEPGVSGSFAFGYNNDDKRTSETLPNGVAVADTYTPAGFLTRTTATKGSGTLLDLSYGYTKGTKDTTLAQTRTDHQTNGVSSYGYDALNRLTQANTTGSPADTRAYAYDGAGNLTSQTINGTLTSLSYNNDNQLTTKGATTYSYDNDGNETASSSGLSIAYNAANQITSVNGQSYSFLGQGQSELSQQGAITLQNDLLGVGVRTNDSGGYSYYTHDTGGPVLRARTPDGTAGPVLGARNPDGTARPVLGARNPDGTAGPVLGARNPDGTRTYNLSDAQGSIAAITDQNGNLISRINYDPWGVPTTTSNPTPTQLAGFSFRFDGGYYSTSAGLYHFGERFYDPTTQRFTQQDPLNQTSDLTQNNRYAFAGGDPVNLSDPSGRFSYADACAAGALGFSFTGPFGSIGGCASAVAAQGIINLASS